MNTEPFDLRVTKEERIKVLTNLGIHEEAIPAVLAIMAGIAASSYEAGTLNANLTTGEFTERPDRLFTDLRFYVAFEDFYVEHYCVKRRKIGWREPQTFPEDNLNIRTYLIDKGLV